MALEAEGRKTLMPGYKRVYLCEDTPDGVFTAVYDAWAEGLPGDSIELRTESEETFSLFCDYISVQTDLEKARKVARSVIKKISREAYDRIYQAALSEKPEKADLIFRFLKLAFRVGKGVIEMYGEPCVWHTFELERNVGHEAHMFTGFVRFSPDENGILIGKIRPKNQVLPLLGPHFADRFPEENWVILDERRGYGIFHRAGSGWIMAPVEMAAFDRMWEERPEDPYGDLWKIFFRTIAVTQRKNPACQRNMCALRYRDYMLEFS